MESAPQTDPLGRRISLPDHSWDHILQGHPEVSGHRDLVEAALSNPREIWFSLSHADRRVYSGRGPRPRVMMVVIADVVRGLVVTAYLSNRPGKGVVEWSSPTPWKG